MREYNLFVDAHVFDGIFQGSRTFLKGIYSNFDTKKYSIKIYLAANNIENLKDEFRGVENIEFIKLQSKNKFIRLAYEIPMLISKLKIDFAHFNYYLPLFLNKDCSYIVTIHDVIFLDYPQYFPKSYFLKNKILFEIAAKRADLLNSVSVYSAMRIKEKFELDKVIDVIPNAIDEKYHTHADKVNDKNYINKKFGISNYLLYVSRLEPRKNHMTLLRTYDELRLWEQDIELLFIGKKAMENLELDCYFEEIKTKSNGKVHHLEYVNNEDLMIFYNAATIACFPSLCEGFGIPPLESAAIKTPTICSNLTAMQEFQFFGKFHIDPTNKVELKYIVAQTLEDIKSGLIYSEMDYISKVIIEKYKWKNTADLLGESIKKKIEDRKIL